MTVATAAVPTEFDGLEKALRAEFLAWAKEDGASYTAMITRCVAAGARFANRPDPTQALAFWRFTMQGGTPPAGPTDAA